MRSAKYIPSPNTLRGKRVKRKIEKSKERTKETLAKKRMGSVKKRELIASAFKRMRTARSRRKTKESINALASNIAKLRIKSNSPVRLTQNQVRNFYRVARPYMNRAVRNILPQNTRSMTGSALTNINPHAATWHNLPSRIELEQYATRHYSPSRLTQGLINPNQFNVIYRQSQNDRKRRYNDTVKAIINKYKLPHNRFEGNTQARYRNIYGRVKNAYNFSRAFRAWQIADRVEKNQKFANLVQKLRRAKLLQIRNFANINNNIANYHNTLPQAVKAVLGPINQIRINRQAGTWNKAKIERALRAIHTIQRSRMT
jgi:hypothetical protein